jgi:hypothetical protein
MLAYFLAIVMAMISLTLYFNAFISPKIHRQDDFLWSGLGLFYALTLWICAEKITGAVLLGQLAVVSLAIAFIWENRQIRKLIIANTESNNLLEGFSLLSFILTSFNKITQLSKKDTPFITKEATSQPPEKTSEVEVETPEIKNNLEVESEENQLLVKEIIEEKVTTVITTEKPLQEDNQIVNSVIEEVIQEETEVIEEEIKVNLEETFPSENNLDDDFDIDSLGLSQSIDNINNEAQKSQGNIFSKFLGFFRKSSPKISDEAETSLSVTDTTKELEIDPNISATEVETAIENLDLVESNNNIEEVQKTIEEDDLTQNYLNQEETMESLPEEVETQTMESLPEEVETQTTESFCEEVETQTMESLPEEVETQTMESLPEEVETQTTESFCEEVETETMESFCEEVETETTESFCEEVETETMESFCEEVETETTESLQEEVETQTMESTPLDGIIDKDSSIELPSAPESDNLKSV